jgi:hypothetical protein
VFKRTKRKGYRQIDNRCKEYCEGCSTCEAYRFLGERGRFPNTHDELWDYIKERVIT